MAKMRAPVSDHQCHVFAVEDAKSIINTQERFWGIGGEFRYLVCPHCNSWTIHPKPSDEVLGQQYAGYYPPEEFAQRREKPITSVERVRAREVWSMLNALNRAEHVEHILDVGTGCGGFLASFREARDVRVSGCDQNPASAELAEELFNIEVAVGEFHSLNYDSNQFDLITLWHCFEHVRSPYETLCALRGYLRENGILMLEVPTPGFWGRFFRGRWLFLQAPTHLHLFTVFGIREQLRAAGFDVLRIQRPWSPSEWAGSILFQLGFSGFMPRLYFRPSRLSDHLWRVLFLCLMPLDLVMTAISALMGSSGLLRVYAEVRDGEPPPETLN